MSDELVEARSSNLSAELRNPAYNDESDGHVRLRAADEIDRLTEALAGAYASVNLLTEMHEKAVAEVAELRRARDAWLQVWDNVKLDNPNLREDNKPLAVAACYGLMKLEMDRMREALVMSVNAMREPFDGWKGEVEALALAAARAALGEQP